MANLSDPVTYRLVQEKLRAKGYKDSQINSALSSFVAREQAPQAVSEGLVSREDAFKATGGLGSPGSVGTFAGIPKTADKTDLGETERKFALGLDAASKARKLLEEGQQTGPIATRTQKAKEFFGGTEGTDFRASLALANTALKSAFLGSGQSSKEIEGLIDAISNPNQQEDVLKTKLDNLITIVSGRVPAGLPTTPPTLEAPTPKEQAGGFSSAPDLTGIATIEQPKKKEESKGISLQDIAGKVAGVAPAVGGTIGGISGGLLGSGVASVPLGAVGATIGTGAGVALQNMIEDLAGIQDESAGEQLSRATKQAAVAGVTDLVLGGAFELVAKGGGAILKSALRGIDDIPLKNLRLNPSQLTKFGKKHGEEVSEFIIKNKILGENSIDIAAGKAGELQKAFDGLALREDIAIPIKNVAEAFAKEIEPLLPVRGKIVAKEAEAVAGSLASNLQNIVDQMKSQGINELTPKMLTELRRQTDELIPKSAFIDPKFKNVSVRLRKVYNNVIQDAVDQRLLGEAGGGLKSLGLELSKYYDFLEIASKQSNLGKGSKVFNLTKLLAGGFGALTGGVSGGAVGLAGGLGLEALSRDPTVLTNLFKAGKVAQTVAPKAGKLIKGAGKLVAPTLSALTAQEALR